MADRNRPLSIEPIPEAEAAEGYALRDAVAALVGHQQFVLVVGRSPDASVYSNAATSDDYLPTLFLLVSQLMRGARPERGKPVTVKG